MILRDESERLDPGTARRWPNTAQSSGGLDIGREAKTEANSSIDVTCSRDPQLQTQRRMFRTSRQPTIFLAALIVFTVVVAASHANDANAASNFRWSKSVVRYKLERPNHRAQRTVDAAAYAWNELGLRVRFARAGHRRPDLVIKVRKKLPGKYPFKPAGLGDYPFGRRQIHTYLRSDLFKPPRDGGNSWSTMMTAVDVAIHELGHNLGFPHSPDSVCSVMNYSFLEHCRRDSWGEPRHQDECGPSWYDYRKSARKYGLRSRRPRHSTCEDLVQRFIWRDIPGAILGSVSVASPTEVSINGSPWTWSSDGFNIKVGDAVRLRFSLTYTGSRSDAPIALKTGVYSYQSGSAEGVARVTDGWATCSGKRDLFLAETCADSGATNSSMLSGPWGFESTFNLFANTQTQILQTFRAIDEGGLYLTPQVTAPVIDEGASVMSPGSPTFTVLP